MTRDFTKPSAEDIAQHEKALDEQRARATERGPQSNAERLARVERLLAKIAQRVGIDPNEP